MSAASTAAPASLSLSASTSTVEELVSNLRWFGYGILDEGWRRFEITLNVVLRRQHCDHLTTKPDEKNNNIPAASSASAASSSSSPPAEEEFAVSSEKFIFDPEYSSPTFLQFWMLETQIYLDRLLHIKESAIKNNTPLPAVYTYWVSDLAIEGIIACMCAVRFLSFFFV